MSRLPLLLLMCLLTALNAHADDTLSHQGTRLTVTAEAEARQPPDIARLSTGVLTQAGDANTALRNNAREMDKVMAALKSAGIAGRDIQTSGISLYPQYRHPRNEAPSITGYQAANTVSIKVREIARLGDVLDALVASGANQVNGPSFAIDEPGPVYDRARLAALDQARQRAELYAGALGLKVGRIISINEGSSPAQSVGLRMMAAAQAMDEAATPVSPGESTLRARVTVVFELGG